VEDGQRFGFEQTDDPVAREHAERWLELGEGVGGYSDADLRGLPLDGYAGDVFDIMMRESADTPACTEATQAYVQLIVTLISRPFALGGELQLPPDAGIQVDAAIERLRNDCLSGLTGSLIDVLAEINGVTAEQMRATLDSSVVALIDNRHPLDGLAATIMLDRSEMRAVEEEFTAATGTPWTQLRYFSTEEAADDASIPVLDAAEFPATGLADGLLWMLGEVAGEDVAADCTDLIDAGETPGFGANLADDHHALCWRVDHIGKLAASGRLYERAAARSSRSTRAYRRTATPTPRFPMPPRYSDSIVY
jgi:hypothetical protein